PALHRLAPRSGDAGEGDGFHGHFLALLRIVRCALLERMETAGGKWRSGADRMGSAIDPAIPGTASGDGIFAGRGAGLYRDCPRCRGGDKVPGGRAVVVDYAGRAHLPV